MTQPHPSEIDYGKPYVCLNCRKTWMNLHEPPICDCDNPQIEQGFNAFSNGTEAIYWEEQNCYECKAYQLDSETGVPLCPLWYALGEFGDGTCRRVIADAIGTYWPEAYQGDIECLSTCRYKTATTPPVGGSEDDDGDN